MSVEFKFFCEENDPLPMYTQHSSNKAFIYTKIMPAEVQVGKEKKKSEREREVIGLVFKIRLQFFVEA